MQVRSKIFYWYAAFVVALTLLTLLPAPSPATLIRFHLTPTSLRLLDVTFLIAEFAIWFAAFYGYTQLSRYSRLTHSGKESTQIAKLARGLLLLSIGLPITALLSAILSIIAAHNPGFAAPSVIINNYAGVVFPLLAMLWLSIGARGLGGLARTRPRFWLSNAVVLATIILGVVFCCLVVLGHKQLRLMYHMSPQLVMLTLGIPYMYTWFLGLYSASELQAYSRKVAGVVYRKAWGLMISGVLGFIFLSIILQYLSTLATWLASLTLYEVLALLYVLLSLFIIAFILFALGAKKLMKIEEV
jgi:hypothetical protein